MKLLRIILRSKIQKTEDYFDLLVCGKLETATWKGDYDNNKDILRVLIVLYDGDNTIAAMVRHFTDADHHTDLPPHTDYRRLLSASQ